MIYMYIVNGLLIELSDWSTLKSVIIIDQLLWSHQGYINVIGYEVNRFLVITFYVILL